MLVEMTIPRLVLDNMQNSPEDHDSINKILISLHLENTHIFCLVLFHGLRFLNMVQNKNMY